MQTRLKPVLDQVTLTLDANGVKLDFSGVESALNSRIAANQRDGLADVLGFVSATKGQLIPAGWDSVSYLANTLRAQPDLTPVQDLLTTFCEWKIVACSRILLKQAANEREWRVLA